jgi:hypothetical protein
LFWIGFYDDELEEMAGGEAESRRLVHPRLWRGRWNEFGSVVEESRSEGVQFAFVGDAKSDMIETRAAGNETKVNRAIVSAAEICSVAFSRQYRETQHGRVKLDGVLQIRHANADMGQPQGHVSSFPNRTPS